MSAADDKKMDYFANWELNLINNVERFSKRWAEISYRKESLSSEDLLLLEEVADTVGAPGLFHEADEILEAVANEYGRRGILFEEQFALLKRIHLRQQCGSSPRLIRELFKDPRAQFASVEDLTPNLKGFDTWEQQFAPFLSADKRKFLLANVYMVLAHLLRQVVRLSAASAVLIQGLKHAKAQQAFDSRMLVCSLQLSWAELQLEKGDFNAFDNSLHECKQQLASTGHAILFRGLKARGALLRGDFANAREILAEILAMHISSSLVLPARKACLNLAQVFIMMNDIADARRLVVAALSDCPPEMHEVRLLATSLLEVIQSRSGLATGRPVIELQKGKPRENRRLFQRQWLRIQLNDLSFNSFQMLVMRFYAAVGIGEIAAAERFYKMASAFPADESYLLKVRVGVMSGVRDFYQGRYGEAAAMFRTQDSNLAHLQLKPERYESLVLWKRSLDKLAETVVPEQRPKLLEESLQVAQKSEELLRELSAFLPAIDKVTFLLNKATQREEALARTIDVLRRERDALQKAPKIVLTWKQIGLWRKLNQLLEKIYHDRKVLVSARLESKEPVRLSKPATLLRRIFLQPTNEANLAFLVLPDSAVVIWWSWMQFNFKIVATSREEIRRLVAQWHEAIVNSRPDLAAYAAEQLCQTLQISQVLKTFSPKVRRLRILADDALHGFPFAAFRDQGRYLIEQYTISLSFHPSKQNGRKYAASPCLLVGVTDGNPPLPQTKEQIKWLSSRFAAMGVQSRVLLDRMATHSHVTQEITKAHLLHLSCHGSFSLEQPKETGIELFNEDGSVEIFGLDQLVSLDLSGLQHATLLSCWAADNYVIPGGWVISLPEVLWYAGTGSIVGSLWQISEECADEFTRQFYPAAMQLPTDEALREAQLALMRDARFAEPFDWAGLQIYGEPVQLRF